MVFQNYAVFPHMTVADNIAFGLKMQKVAPGDIARKVKRAADLMQIGQPARTLLRAIVRRPAPARRRRPRARRRAEACCFMDEPLSNLDALLRLEMRAELKGVLAESKTTTIYVTHDQVEAMSLADRIAVMHGGHIVQAASAMDVYARPATRFVGGFIGNPPMNFLAARAARATRGGRRRSAPSRRRQATGRSSSASGRRMSIPATTAVMTASPPSSASIEPLGPHQLVSLDVGGENFRAVLDNRHARDGQGADAPPSKPQAEQDPLVRRRNRRRHRLNFPRLPEGHRIP